MKGSHLFTTGPQRNRLAAFKDRDRVNSSVTSEIPVHHKNHLQFWTCQHLSKQRQVSTSAIQELRGKKKNLSKDSSTCNSCTILKIKYFKLVCKSFVGFFFFTLTGPLPTETKSLYWDNIIHVTHALLPNSHLGLPVGWYMKWVFYSTHSLNCKEDTEDKSWFLDVL